MFCPNCGTNMEENAAFCPNCGTPNTPAAAPSVDVAAPAPAKKKSKGKLIGWLAAGIAAVVAIILLFGGGGAKSVTNKVMKAVYKTGDGKAIVSTMPKQVIESMEENGMDKEDLIEILDEGLEYTIEYIEENDVKVSWKVSDTEKLDKDEIEELQERYENLDVDLKISAAQEITYEVTAKEDGDKDTEEITLTAIKVGGKWYLDYLSFDF